MQQTRTGFATFTGFLLACLALATPAFGQQAPLTLDELFASPAITGTSPSSPRWSPNSQYLAFAWNEVGLPQRHLYIVDAAGTGLRKMGDESLPPLRDFAWLPDGSALLSLRGDGLWLTNLESDGETRELAGIGAGASRLSLAPDGKTAAYLQQGDLVLFDLETRQATAATAIGLPGLSSLPKGRYSRAEREIGPGIWGGPTYRWSPDSKTIAVHVVDRRSMGKVPFPDYLADETSPNEVRRGYPGQANESRTVGLLDVASRNLELLPLENLTGNQVIGFDFSPDGTLLIDTASDTAIDRWLFTVAPGSKALQPIWHSHRPSRIYTSFASAWHPDGQRIIVLSDRNDRYGLFVIDPAATDDEPTLISDPAFDVLSAPAISAGDGALFFAGNGVNTYERHVYRLGPDDGELRQLTTQAGQNTGIPSPDGRRIAVLHNNDTAPSDLFIVDVTDGASERVTTSPLPAFYEQDWVAGRYVSFPSEIDDYTLHARILEPANLDRSRKYPVLFGPMYSNTARNRWAGTYSRVQQLLVQKGYIVVQVDVRGSTGYGRDFREEFLVDFAGDDIEDIESAVNYMKTLPYVDGDRLGIWGSSYGGTLSIYTLLKKPGLFKAGVAAAAAVDPFFFGTDDVAIVRRPETHPEVFLNQAVRYADNLEDHLLIIHGMQDQVVPFKTTAVLADELIRRGKDFDFAFAAGATHSWSREPYYGRYLFGKLIAHFDRYLALATE